MFRKASLHALDDLFKILRLGLVCLGEHHLKGDGGAVEEFHDLAIDWLAQVVRDARLRVADVSIVRDPQAGRVTATFGLERPTAAPR